ncbi:hypothetical protein Poly41_14230 [Novipirellula artificiosorum]|uniref:Uncharacterized protein n=1 Tax=Novipirellula artificiosorum TaxID=2528016 RepID=A0A5C6DV75_9BACT|nr:hypothetical protein Poly41_14230 [Novipirellula artificiosorum]
MLSRYPDSGSRQVDEAGALSVRAISACRCPDCEDTDASFTPTELRSADATDFTKKSPFLDSVNCTSAPNGEGDDLL